MKPRLYLALLVSFLALAVVAYFERDPLLAVAAWAWVVDEKPRKADAILILAGSPGTRPQSAVRLYQAGWAPRILITKTVNPACPAQPRRRRGLSEREARIIRLAFSRSSTSRVLCPVAKRRGAVGGDRVGGFERRQHVG